MVSHNAQGLNSLVKRQKIFHAYQSQKVNIVLFQETHFPKRYIPSFLHAHYPQFFLANAEDKTRGVAILISKTCKFTPQLEHRDPEGRFILVMGMLNDHLYLLVSYYASNKGQHFFYKQCSKP